MTAPNDDVLTAYHEAGHAVALHSMGETVHSVSVFEHGSGETMASMPGDPDDFALAALAGMVAEGSVIDGSTFDVVNQFGKAYAGAAADRDAIDKEYRTVRATKPILWHQTHENKALVFVQKNEAGIEMLAQELLKQAGFPKTLSGQALSVLLTH